MKKLVAVLALFIITLTIVPPVLADGIIIIDPPPEPPPDWSPWLTIRYHRVTTTIEGQIAVTKVDQVFRNEGRGIAEGTYVFPLPPGAMVQRFTMWVDGQPLEGEILPADKAREIYEDYVRQRRDPALLEYVGRDTVRARIFPIPPGEERRIQLEYIQVLQSEAQLLHYVYPLNTERFSARPLEQVSIYVEIDAESDLRAIYSPSHQDEVVITHQGARHATISYEASDVLPARDFELYVGTSTEDIEANLLTHKPVAEDGFFLLMLSPALEVETQRILAKDILLVLDTSGSMDGEKLKQAQEALVYILKHLNPEDRFNVIAFSSGVRSYAPVPQPGTEASKAIDWVYDLEAIGGTNIYLALSEALMQADQKRPSIVIFLTDGLPTEGIIDEKTLLDMLKQESPGSVRVFPFGVGYDVNTLFLDQLAEEHKGRSAYVEPHQRIDEQVSAFYARVQSPLLTNVTLDFGNVRIYDVYPQPLPDLYAGTQLIVTGRYTGSGPQRITLTGEVNNEQKVYIYEGTFTSENDKDFIPRLWAARRIGHLLTQIRLHGENEEWVDAIVTLSLRYGIITPYTSFLVEEPDDVLTVEGRDRAVEEFEKSLQIAPAASGEEAVEDAIMREGLGGAAAPPAAPESPSMPVDEGVSESGEIRYVRYVGDKTFLCRDSVCIDTIYIPDEMETRDIVFMSTKYWELLDKYPQWAAYFALGTESIFVAADGTAYRFYFGSADEEVLRPQEAGTPGATLQPDPTRTPGDSALTQAHTETPPAQSSQDSAPNLGLCSGAMLLIVVAGVVNYQGRKRNA